MILNYLADRMATATCTLNGQPTSCKDAAGAIAGVGLFFVLFIIFCIVSTIFWIISLVHVLTHEDVNDRVLWIVVIIFVPFGAWVYFFGPRRKYKKQHTIAPNNFN